jgi:hypothetical protein
MLLTSQITFADKLNFVSCLHENISFSKMPSSDVMVKKIKPWSLGLLMNP